jgi:3-dehydroquinate dehydratase-2
MEILLLHGPNLNALGARHGYGTFTLEEVVEKAELAARSRGYEFSHAQSNSETQLVTAIQDARNQVDGIVINAGALTHYSWAIADALKDFGKPVVELHITNTLSRESWRHVSVLAPVAAGTIQGFGLLGYELAVSALCTLIAKAA